MDIPKNRLQGLAGWLTVMAISLLAEALGMAATFAARRRDYYFAPPWDRTPSDYTYSGWPWRAVVTAEVALAVLALIGIVMMLYTFFGKRRSFPPMYIGLHMVMLVFFFIDTLCRFLLFPERPLLAPAGIAAALQALLPVLVGIPYLRNSARVKLTFVK